MPCADRGRATAMVGCGTVSSPSRYGLITAGYSLGTARLARSTLPRGYPAALRRADDPRRLPGLPREPAVRRLVYPATSTSAPRTSLRAAVVTSPSRSTTG